MKNIKYLLLFTALTFLAGCHKDPPKTYDDLDMTITYYNTSFDFNSYSTFIMPDSTVLKTNYLTDDQIAKFYKSGGTSDKTLDLLKGYFVGMGYTQVNTVDEADFIPLPTVMMMKSDETIIYNPGWWWGYPGYGWGWGYYKSTDYYGWYPVYPWYPTGVPVTVSSYNGTVAYEMVDGASYRALIEWIISNPNPGDSAVSPSLEVNWQAMLEGSITDDGSYNEERIEKGTEEAFAQSEYLKK